MKKQIKQDKMDKAIAWYLKLPLLVVLFFIFPPISTIISIVLFIKRWKLFGSNSSAGKRTIIAFVSTCAVCVALVIITVVNVSIEDKKLSKINTAIDNGDYITAEALIDEEYNNDYIPYDIIKAKARMYEKQGLFNEAVGVILDYCEKEEDKTLIYDSAIKYLEEYKGKCDELTAQRIDATIASRNLQLEEKANEKIQAKTDKEQKKAQKIAEKEKKEAEKQALKKQKADAKAQKAAEKENVKKQKSETTAPQKAEETQKMAGEEKLKKEVEVENSSAEVYENSDFATLDIINHTWYLEKDGSLLLTVDFQNNHDGIMAVLRLGYGIDIIKIKVLCVLDSPSHAVGYDDGSGIGGLAKYTGEFEEGTENYIELMVKNSELYLSIHAEDEVAEYDKLISDTARDLHKGLIDSVIP